MKKTQLATKLSMLAALLLVACSPPEAVKDPTWADVYPILQGQCLGCHGSTAATDGGSYRFDFLDASVTCKQEPADDLPLGFSPPPSFMSARKQILLDIVGFGESVRPKMPPEPARLLEDWQVKTLQNFIAKLDGVDSAGVVKTAMGPLPSDARPPRIQATFVRAGAELTVNYQVTDDNADPVIGKLIVNDRLSKAVPSAGRGQAIFNIAGLPLPLKFDARLCDGYSVKTRGAADGLVVP